MTYVDDIVLPADVAERNWIDVGVEEERNINHGKHIAHALGANRERQNLDGVADK